MSERPTLILVHSPLVGPLTWQATAETLCAKGFPVAVPDLRGALEDGPPYYPKLAEAAAARTGGSVVLVGDSGAGALLPAIGERLTAPVEAAVFVDALLPHPGTSWFDTAPPALREQLTGLVRDGRLPPWHEWFPPGTVDALLPDAELRARFAAELSRVPVEYFREPAPVTPGWPPTRCAYVRLSEPYEAAAVQAERDGWAVYREDADHLAMLSRPAELAGRLSRIVSDWAPDTEARPSRGRS